MKHMSKQLILLIAILIFGICQFPLAASKGNTGAKRTKEVEITAVRALGYSFADESHEWPDGRLPATNIMPVGVTSASSGSASPGVTVGYTWYDYQQNCSMGRMIETGPHSGGAGKAVVHFSWMFLPDSAFVSRSYAYSAYLTEDHSLLSPVILHDPEKQYSGYVNMDATSDGRAVIGGHCDLLTGAQHYLPQLHFDGGPGYATFPNYVRVPDTIAAWEQISNTESLWPKFMLQFGTDTVLHITGRSNGYLGSLMYFRLVGYEGSPDAEWDYPPYVYDTVQCYSHDLTGQRTGDRLAIAWLASLPYQEPFCDTCSGINEFYETFLIGQMDNDIYYQVSDDQGASWHPRVNMTQIPLGEAGFKPYPDLSLLFDQNSDLHIVWTGVSWPADLCWDDGGFCFSNAQYGWLDRSRLFHWSENVPYIRPISDHTYAPSDSCGAPKWAVTVAKVSVSECDGNLYTIWSQFNDIPNGIIDDCAQWVYDDNSWEGGANADIWLSVSSDQGMTWDKQRNLTNSYTPHCDPYYADDCQSDYWASMGRWGRQSQPDEDWTGAEVVDPSGGTYTGDHYLDIQYVNDLDAGGAIWTDADGSEGTWTYNPIKWFRIPCVDPIPAPVITFGWRELGDPNYVKPGISFDTTLMLENIGNAELTYTVTVIEDTGPAGWLGTSGFSGVIPSGLAGIEVGLIHLNQNLMTTTGNYYGRLHFEGNDLDNLPADVEIELIIADTMIATEWDYVTATLPTDAENGVSLAVSNNGNMGHDGIGKYNMDFYPNDCDTTATVYMYDGSPLVGWIDGTDTVFNYSIWGQTYTMQYGFRSQGGEFNTKTCAGIGQVYESGTFTTQDSTIGITKVYVAPLGQGPFVIEYLRVWSYDGATHDGLAIGEAIDWDIPTDFLIEDTGQQFTAVNSGGMDPERNLLYCVGYEAYGVGSDTVYPYNCQYNDARFGGSAFIGSYLNEAQQATYPEGGYVVENDSTQTTNGFDHSLLWQTMMQTGFFGTDSTEDLHTLFTYENNISLGADDVYEAISVIATIQNGSLDDLKAAIDAGEAWYTANGGIDMFEKDPVTGRIFVCGTCCSVMGKFYQDGQPFSILDIDNFTEWLLRNPGTPDDYDCLEETDVSGPEVGVPDGVISILDLDYQIGYLLRGDYSTLGECP